MTDFNVIKGKSDFTIVTRSKLRAAIERHFKQTPTPADEVVRRAEELKPPPRNEIHHPQDDKDT